MIDRKANIGAGSQVAALTGVHTTLVYSGFPTLLAYIRNLRTIAYDCDMKAVFVELPAFTRHRAEYLDDDAFLALEKLLMKHPEAGDLIPGTGGLRKTLKDMIKTELEARRSE